MANWGTGQMRLKGKEEDVKNFIKHFDYDNETGKYFSKQILEDVVEISNNNGIVVKEVFFQAGWSVKSSFMSGEMTYYDDKINKPERFIGDIEQTRNSAYCIELACKDYQVDCEIWFEEPGCNFQEYVFVNNKGEVISSESESAVFHYIDDEEYENYTDEELNKLFKGEEQYIEGGFKNYLEWELK